MYDAALTGGIFCNLEWEDEFSISQWEKVFKIIRRTYLVTNTAVYFENKYPFKSSVVIAFRKCSGG